MKVSVLCSAGQSRGPHQPVVGRVFSPDLGRSCLRPHAAAAVCSAAVLQCGGGDYKWWQSAYHQEHTASTSALSAAFPTFQSLDTIKLDNINFNLMDEEMLILNFARHQFAVQWHNVCTADCTVHSAEHDGSRPFSLTTTCSSKTSYT